MGNLKSKPFITFNENVELSAIVFNIFFWNYSPILTFSMTVNLVHREKSQSGDKEKYFFMFIFPTYLCSFRICSTVDFKSSFPHTKYLFIANKNSKYLIHFHNYKKRKKCFYQPMDVSIKSESLLPITNRKVTYNTSKGSHLPNFHLTFYGLLLKLWRELYIARIKTQLLSSNCDLCDIVSIFC